MQDSVTYQAILAKGFANGAAEAQKGIAEAQADATANGKAEGIKCTILRLGQIRFGLPDEAIARRLESITDLDQLELLAERILQASSWAELLPPA